MSITSKDTVGSSARIGTEWGTIPASDSCELNNFNENIDYLNHHHLLIYLDDAVSQMLSLRLESNKIKPSKFLKEYFCSVHQGTHVLFREYEFISSTPYNRLCVMKALMQIYKQLLYKEEKLNKDDYHSLLLLVWPDFPIQEVNAAFAPQNVSEEVQHLSFLEFIIAMKNTFCVGEFDYEARIIDSQVKIRIEEFSKITKQGEKFSLNLSEAEFLSSLEDNASDQASSWSVASNFIQTNEFRKILTLKESNSFSSDEPVEGTSSKLSRSSSGSKEASKSEQNVSIFSRASSASLRGRLSGKQLSNSLTLLQTDRLESESFSTRRHRSKSAVTIQRSYQPTRN